VQVLEQRIVCDGKICSAAGVSVGIDLAQAMIAEEAGQDVAGKVQLAAEYYSNTIRYGNAHQVPEVPGYYHSSQH